MRLPIRTGTDSSTSQQSTSSRPLTPDTEAPDPIELDKRQRWEDALKHCRKELPAEDFKFIVNFKSPEEVVKAVDELINSTTYSSVPRTLRNLKSHLSQVKTFLLVLAATTLDVVETVCIWGLITLTLQQAEKSEEILKTITEMWIDIGNSLHIFDSYKSYIVKDETLSLALFETYEELLMFAVATIKTLSFVTKGQHGRCKDENKHIADCKAKFDKTSTYISNRIQMIKENVEAQVLVQDRQTSPRAEMLQYLTKNSEVPIPPVAEEKPKVSCHYIHFPRNTNFYGREDIMIQIDASFSKHREKGNLASVALWATAGIGKTQIALEYAYQQKDAGLEAIFWIDMAEETEYFKAFNDIAHLLELPGASGSRDFEQNRLLVLRWLQETKTPWLIIFDNVDDPKILDGNTPTHGCGTILLTCRSELTAASVALTKIAVRAFAESEGSNLLLQNLNLSAPTDAEKAASLELSDLLGGHALAIDVMARSILVKKKKLPDFVRSYKEKPRAMHKKPRQKIVNKYYKRDDYIESLWAIPFGGLESDEADILGILSMCGPNKFPSSALVSEEMEEDDVDEILPVLEDLSLVIVDDSRAVSTHRLIQVEFRNHLSREKRVERWCKAVDLLRAAFPRQEKGSTLFNRWPECELLIEHVMALTLRHHELEEDGELEYLEDFVYLLSDAARYLSEVGRHTSCQQVLAYGLQYCREKTSIAYSNLCVNMGSLYCERGQDKSGLKHNDLVLQIREGCLDPMDTEIANALSNSALNMVACGQDVEKALEMLQRALKIDMSHPHEVNKVVIHLRHFNLGFAYRALGRLEEARECVDKASACARAEFGEDSRYLTISYRMYADFAMQAQKYEEAYEHAVRSHEIAKLSGAMTAWVASSLYYMGNIRLCQGKSTEAVEHLEEARIITLLNEREKSDAGESARVLHKLAQAYAMAGDAEKANTLSHEADTIYQRLIETGEYSKSDDERQKWDYLICIKFR